MEVERERGQYHEDDAQNAWGGKWSGRQSSSDRAGLKREGRDLTTFQLQMCRPSFAFRSPRKAGVDSTQAPMTLSRDVA